MNLRLGCREKKDKNWIYYLCDGSALDRQEWIDLVERQIREQGHQQKFDEIKKTVKLWNKDETVHEIALQVYASKYCTNISQVGITKKMSFKVVKDSMGCDQLSL